MSGRALMWILRAAAFGLFALYLLARFVFVDPRAIYMVGAIGMGGRCASTRRLARGPHRRMTRTPDEERTVRTGTRAARAASAGRRELGA